MANICQRICMILQFRLKHNKEAYGNHMARVNDIAIDLGTSRVLIYMKEHGIMFNQPAIVAVDRDTRTILEMGDKAEQMIGRAPSGVMVISPLASGKIFDYDLVSAMLKEYVRRVIGKRLFSRPKAVMVLPTGLTDGDRRALISTMYDAGMKSTRLLDRALAAALGAGLNIDEAYGTMVVDISAGVTDIGVISYGKVLVQDYTTVGGDAFNDAIIRHLRNKHSLLIGERTAEELKINLGSAVPRTEQLYMDVTGRNQISGLPKTMKIYNSDITDAFAEPLSQLINSINGVLEHTPAELASDIFEYGILLTGGGAQMFGLCEAIADALKVPCTCAEDPQNNIINGCARVLDNLQDLGRFLNDGRNRR